MGLEGALLIVLAAVSVVYLITTLYERGLLQSVLKGTLAPLILVIYLVGASHLSWAIIVALIFGWLGDIFLLAPEVPLRFKLGLGSFLIGHLGYVVAMAHFITPVRVPTLVASIIGAAVIAPVMFHFLRPKGDQAEFQIPVAVYMATILTMAIFALQLFFAQGGRFGAFVLLGALLFVASDAQLAYGLFRKDTKLGYIGVMITYISAQLLIILGFTHAPLGT